MSAYSFHINGDSKPPLTQQEARMANQVSHITNTYIIEDAELSALNGGVSWGEIGAIGGAIAGTAAGITVGVLAAPLAAAAGVSIAGGVAVMTAAGALSGGVDGGIVGGTAQFVKDHI